MSATPQQMPTFGRKYQVQVQLPDSDNVLTVTDSSFEPEALRATFDIYTPALQAWWYADIDLYNLDQVTTTQLLARPIKQGAMVTISAGYQNGNYGIIWSGPVFQPLFDRQNVVDFKITLHCMLGLAQFLYNNVSTAYVANLNQYDLLNKMTSSAFRPIPIGKITPDRLQKKTLPRGGVFFGRPDKYLTGWANDSNSQWWLAPNGLQFGQADDDVPTQSVDFVYTPNSGIIGVPTQTQYGVDFRVLLDPRIIVKKPLPVIRIDNSIIRQQKKSIGELPNILDQDGEYIVAAAHHFGDTRGNDWYTDITGVTSTGGKMAMIQAAVGASTNTPQ